MSEIQSIPWKMFLDDERFPADNDPDWVVVRHVNHAKELIQDYGPPYFMTLDHDLGEDLNGHDFAKWFVEYLMDTETKWNGRFYVHSQNPVGRDNIQNYLDSFVNSDIYRKIVSK